MSIRQACGYFSPRAPFRNVRFVCFSFDSFLPLHPLHALHPLHPLHQHNFVCRVWCHIWYLGLILHGWCSYMPLSTSLPLSSLPHETMCSAGGKKLNHIQPIDLLKKQVSSVSRRRQELSRHFSSNPDGSVIVMFHPGDRELSAFLLYVVGWPTPTKLPMLAMVLHSMRTAVRIGSTPNTKLIGFLREGFKGVMYM